MSESSLYRSLVSPVLTGLCCFIEPQNLVHLVYISFQDDIFGLFFVCGFFSFISHPFLWSFCSITSRYFWHAMACILLYAKSSSMSPKDIKHDVHSLLFVTHVLSCMYMFGVNSVRPGENDMFENSISIINIMNISSEMCCYMFPGLL